jgi:hypothetical protein
MTVSDGSQRVQGKLTLLGKKDDIGGGAHVVHGFYQ